MQVITLLNVNFCASEHSRKEMHFFLITLTEEGYRAISPHSCHLEKQFWTTLKGQMPLQGMESGGVGQ